MKPEWLRRFAPFIGQHNLEIGCGLAPRMQGWLTLDTNPDAHPDFLHDLHTLPLPFSDGTFDTVLASHVLEHIEQSLLMSVVYDIARILRRGGHLIAIVPYGHHSSAWDNPFHRQRFTEMTWNYFDRRLYEKPDTAGHGANQGQRVALWSKQMLGLTPDAKWLGKPDDQIDAARACGVPDVIEEMQVVLRKEGM